MFETEVERGIKWLDSHIPGWTDKIDLNTLDLQLCTRCVIGQVLGDYNELFDRDAPAWDERFHLGFNARIGFGCSSEWQALTAQWKKQIRAKTEVREPVYA